MRVLITGGCGFLGKHFALRYAQQGADLTIVDDLSSNGAVPPRGAVRFRAMDIVEWLRSPDAQRDYDIAIHLAAPVGGRVRIESDPMYNARSLAIDAEFFRWAPGRVGKVVYPSSSAVYGTKYQKLHDHRPLQESLFEPWAPDWASPDEMYGFTKMAGEVLAWKAAAYKLDTLCIRPFSGYGEGQSFDYPIPSIAARVIRRENPITVWGSGKQTRDLIHVEDLVNLTLARLRKGVDGYEAMNLGSGVRTTFLEIAEVMCTLEGVEPNIKTDPRQPEGVGERYADITQQSTVGPLKVLLAEGMSRVLKDVRRRLNG